MRNPAQINRTQNILRKTISLILLAAPILATITTTGCGSSAPPPTPPPTPTAVSITTQPTNQSVVVGQAATFTVAATGTAPLTYQWSENSTPIAGATSATYTTPPTSAADNNATFTVTVNNATSSATSKPATLTVTSTTPVSITAQPTNQSVLVGQAATFTVAATGTAPLTYQWSKNGTPIAGATSATYTTPPTTSADNNAVFTVTVSNATSSAPSNPATLTVATPVSITTQPASQSVPFGQTATFTVAAAGTAPLTYQWSENGTPIAGATSATYTTPPTTSADNNAVFTVTVSNALSSAPSNPATLTVGPRPPNPNDLRFQLVASPITAVAPTSTQNGTAVPGLQQLYYQNNYGTPLLFGDATCSGPIAGSPLDCSWGYTIFGVPPVIGLTVYYAGQESSQLATDFATFILPPVNNTVLFSFDLEPANSAFGASWYQTTQNIGYSATAEIVAPADVQAQSTTDGAQSRVITAVSFDGNGQANMYSYSWSVDTTTQYETQTILETTPANIANDATTLAAAGYIITAFGGNTTNGFLLIGTRVKGDTIPRPIQIQTTPTPSFNTVGWSIVGRFEYSTGTSTTQQVILYEQ